MSDHAADSHGAVAHGAIAHGGGHHGVGDPHVQMQFDDAQQQKDSASLGMWLFLSTEVLFFGAVLTAFFVYRNVYFFEAFKAASHRLNIPVATANTAVLLFSSFSMAMAVFESHHAKRKGRVAIYLLLTFVFGAGFLGVKAFEYHHDWVEGLIPGLNWHPHQAFPAGLDNGAQLFFIFYFFLTMLHALHMTIGMALLLVMAARAKWDNTYVSQHPAQVEMFGLYWHFVDIVWIFLFPILYLIG